MKKLPLLILIAGMLFFLGISKPKAQEVTGGNMLKSDSLLFITRQPEDFRLPCLFQLDSC